MEISDPSPNVSVEALTGIWERLAERLKDSGVPADRIAASFWAAAALQASDPMKKIAPAAERHKADVMVDPFL